MGVGCCKSLQDFFEMENQSELRHNNKIPIKKMEKKVSFDDLNQDKSSQKRKNSGSDFFGVFDSGEKQKKGILKPPSPRNKNNNVIIDNKLISNQDSTNNNLIEKKDIISINNNLTETKEKANEQEIINTDITPQPVENEKNIENNVEENKKDDKMETNAEEIKEEEKKEEIKEKEETNLENKEQNNELIDNNINNIIATSTNIVGEENNTDIKINNPEMIPISGSTEIKDALLSSEEVIKSQNNNLFIPIDSSIPPQEIKEENNNALNENNIQNNDNILNNEIKNADNIENNNINNEDIRESNNNENKENKVNDEVKNNINSGNVENNNSPVEDAKNESKNEDNKIEYEIIGEENSQNNNN